MRVIDMLRKKYPGKWTYQHGWWKGEKFNVYRTALLSPRYDGDDDSFVSQLRRNDTGEVIDPIEIKFRFGQ